MAGKKIRSYRDLEIWQMARELVVPVHKMTLEKLPKFEMYEEGSQIRRSSKSISSNIVEGYGRSRYRNEYIKFLTYALASCDETRDHLEMIYETGSLTDKTLYEDIHKRYDILGRMINNFRQSVIVGHALSDDSDQQKDAGT
jgi:four helix bundle protein